MVTIRTTRTTRTTRKPDAASSSGRRSETGSMMTDYNQEDYELIPTARWPEYFLVGKILAYPLERKYKGVWLYRRGVIVESFGTYSTLLQIKSYGGSGCVNRKEEQKSHSAVYVGSCPPSTEQEPSLRVPIQASRLDVQDSKNMRINYNGQFNSNNTQRVREVGQVSERDVQVLLAQYREVRGIAQESTAAPSPNTLDSDATPVTRVEDEQRLLEGPEGSGPQRNGEKDSANLARIQTSGMAAVHSLAEISQTQQQPESTGSAATPRTPPKEPAGPSGAPPLPSNEKPTPSSAILKENPSNSWLQEGNTELLKTLQIDVENRPTAPPLVAKSSGPVPSARPPQPEQPVSPTKDALSIETLPARATPPTIAIETPLAEGNHVTPTDAIGPINDTTTEEVTGPVELSVPRTANTVSAPQAGSSDIQALPQMVVNVLQQFQDAISSFRDFTKRQDMRYLDYTAPPFPIQEVVASVNLPPPAYADPPQTMDTNLPHEPEKQEPDPSGHAVDDILVPPPAPTPPPPALGYEPDRTYGEQQHHTTVAYDPAHSYHQQSQPSTGQSNCPPESSNAAATRPYNRSPPKSPYHREIWLQDDGFKSMIYAFALVDTGADDNFISQQAVERLKANIYPYRGHVTLGNGKKQAIYGSVGLHFGLISKPIRYQDQFIVVDGLPFDVVFGRYLNDRLEFFLPNKKMLILSHTWKGKPTKEDAQEADRQAQENDQQAKEKDEREREETRARRAEEQRQKGS